MRITFHAAQRFVQRVLKRQEVSSTELFWAKGYLEALTRDIILSSYSGRFALPGFGRFSCVCQENTLITIIPKDKKVLKHISKSRRMSREAYAA